MRRMFTIGTLFSALCVLPASAILDTNSNGMSDLWVRAYNGGELFPSTDYPYGPQDDPDGDGWTNEQEAAAGTDPFDATSPNGFVRPEVVILHDVLLDLDHDEIPESYAEVATISWPVIAGKQYTLLTSPNLTSWMQVEQSTALIDATWTYNVPIGDDEAKFWRVSIEDVDSDGDGLTDAEESVLATDPHQAQTINGLPDKWLAKYFYHTLTSGGLYTINPAADPDGDGLTNAQEALLDTNPKLADTDGDGINDADELSLGTSPVNPDTDGDGMKDGQELAWGFDPLFFDPDTDGDGMPDVWEVMWGLDPLNPADGTSDVDGDHVSNLRELQIGTCPTGFYRVEVLPVDTYPYFQSAGDDGSVVVRETAELDSSQALVTAPDAGGTRSLVVPVPPSDWADLETITADLVTDGIIEDGKSLMADVISSSDGHFRVFPTTESSGRLLVVQEPGIYFSELIPDVCWQAVNNSGRVAGTINRDVPASDDIPAHTESDVVLQNGAEICDIPMPAEWFPAPSTPLIQTLSDDGLLLIQRSVTNPDETIRHESYLLNASTRIFSLVRLPGLGAEEIVCISRQGGRMLGSGPKPFLIADGTLIFLADLQIRSSSTTAAVTLSSLYSNPLVPNHIASDGRITLTTLDSADQRLIIQIIPHNDLNQNGMADDWEASQIAYLVAADPENWGYLAASGSLDPDTHYWNSSQTAAQAFASGSNPGNTAPQKKVLDMPRYALFPIANAQPPTSQQAPIQISDKGTVLYQNGTWKAGSWTALALSGPNMTSGVACAVNDNDVIIGKCATQTIDGDERACLTGVCAWLSPTAQPFRISVGSGFASLTTNGCVVGYGLMTNDLSPGPVLSNDGSFYMSAVKWNSAEHVNKNAGFARWTLPAASGKSCAVKFTQIVKIIYNQGDYAWQTTGGYGNIWGEGGGVFTAVDYKAMGTALPFLPINLVALPNGSGSSLPQGITLPKGSVVAMSRDPSKAAKAYYAGAWHDGNEYSKAIDMSSDGTAIGYAQDNKTAPCLLDGKWVGIDRSCPRLPDEWKNSTVQLVDTTPGGWVLAKRQVSPTNALMLPIKVDGINKDVTPSNLESAGGVDRLSMTADKGTGQKPEIWIMAPIGDSNTVRYNTVRFRNPLNSVSNLALSCDNASFVPAVADKTDLEIKVTGNGASSDEVKAKLKLGDSVESVSTPIMIKVMKLRTVKVALHMVKGKVKDHPEIVTTPPHMPTKSSFENYLNAVFGKQVNVFFDCTEPIVEAGTDGNGILFDADGNGDVNVSSWGTEATMATPNARSTASPQTANIDVWIVGGGIRLIKVDPDGLGGSGQQAQPVDGCQTGTKVIVSDLYEDPSNPRNLNEQQKGKYVLYVIAHEIGHVMTGKANHPQDKNSPARLEWNDMKPDPYVSSRLMSSGEAKNAEDPGVRLIKAEWDLIEEWLKNEEAHQRLP